MNDLIPAFNFHDVFVAPYQNLESVVWILLMGFLVTVACGLIGNYMVLRRMSLVGDAISHSVLPGIVIAFLLTKSRGPGVIFSGALVAGILTTILIEFIHSRSRIKQDAAIGITFSTLFAIGVILVSLFSSQVDLDQDCILYGELGLIGFFPRTEFFGLSFGPEPVFTMGLVTIVVVVLILLFYKELLVSSFDPGLAASLGIKPVIMHYALMSALSVVVVSAFESVGAILVVAMLILPASTAYLLTHRLPSMMFLSIIHSALSALLGYHLSVWLNCQVAPAMVVMGSVIFVFAWIFSPSQGLLARWTHRTAPLDTTDSAA